MAQDQPAPPELERPWYYERWFLVPVFAMGWPLNTPPFVLWPVWSILILRSPWHDHMLLRGLAWAMLFTGAVLEYRNFQGPNGVAFAVALMVPGAIVIVITQVMWSRFRLEHGLVVQKPDPPDFPDGLGDITENTESRQSRLRRRSQRRRSTRSGRSSR